MKKAENERERLESLHQERIKELSGERDSLLKELLDTKLKYESHLAIFEQIKVCCFLQS